MGERLNSVVSGKWIVRSLQWEVDSEKSSVFGVRCSVCGVGMDEDRPSTNGDTNKRIGSANLSGDRGQGRRRGVRIGIQIESW